MTAPNAPSVHELALARCIPPEVDRGDDPNSPYPCPDCLAAVAAAAGPPAHGKVDPEHVLADAYFRRAVTDALADGDPVEAVVYDRLQCAAQDGLADLESAGYRIVRREAGVADVRT